MTAVEAHQATLHVPDIDEDTDTLSAALAYAGAGWYVGPLDPGTKHPGSLLGKGWPTKTSRDPKVIAGWFAGTMQGTGLFLHVGRSGALVLDVDHPDAVPDILQPMLEEGTKRPYQSTRPDCAGRGHYLFLQPEGRSIGNGTGKLGKGWGDVRGLNGVIVAAPTPHPDGGEYRWVKTGPVCHLPTQVVDLLEEASPASDAATDEQVQRFLAEHVSEDRTNLLGAVVHHFRGSVAAGDSRHASMVDAVCWAARESRMGFYPAQLAHDTLQVQFVEVMVDAVADRRRLGRAEALDEFAGIFAWAVAQANAVPESELTERRSKSEERVPERPSMNGHGEIEPAAATASAVMLPEEFWTRRPILEHIRQAAHSRTRSGDLVLHAVLARFSANIPHTYELPPITGSPSSLNFYSLPVGPSGAGKSSGVQIAISLLPRPEYEVRDIPLGSGEGIAELYMGEVKDEEGKKVRQQIRHNAFLYIDEGSSLIEQATNRKGATLAGTLRSAWGGEQLGQANASGDRTRIIPRGQYTLGLVVGFQDELAADLLQESVAGTPQRFMWVRATDPNIPNDPVDWPDQLQVPSIPGDVLKQHQTRSPRGYLRHQLTVDDAIRHEIRGEQVQRSRGALVLEALDAHRPLHLLKTSGLLAILDGRLHVNLDDWELAKIMWETSCRVRSSVVATVSRYEEQVEEARVARHASREQAAEAARRGAPQAVERIARKIADWVHNAGEDGSTRTDLRSPLASRDRPLFDSAADFAIEEKWITEQANRYYPGESRPAS